MSFTSRRMFHWSNANYYYLRWKALVHRFHWRAKDFIVFLFLVLRHARREHNPLRPPPPAPPVPPANPKVGSRLSPDVHHQAGPEEDPKSVRSSRNGEAQKVLWSMMHFNCNAVFDSIIIPLAIGSIILFGMVTVYTFYFEVYCIVWKRKRILIRK